MPSIPDSQLYEHGNRVKDRVVLITGAANGFGREAAKQFASHGAKVVIGDRDVSGAASVVTEILQNGGQAVSASCDVTVWEDLVALYELSMKEYGAVDVVVANAGIGEVGRFSVVNFENGRPVKPNLSTLDVNLIGLTYTVNLAQHYLNLDRTNGDLKSIVLLGSIASWTGILGAPMYAASKHAALGIMRSLHPTLELANIRIGIIHPFFADTGIVPSVVKLFLAGIPLVPVHRVAGAIFYVATSPDKETNGCAFMLPDDGTVFMVPREDFKMGVYEMLDRRRNSLLRVAKGAQFAAAVARDVFRVLWKPFLLISIVALSMLVQTWVKL